jgi:D-alanyl-D-alanine carboxypeptidase
MKSRLPGLMLGALLAAVPIVAPADASSPARTQMDGFIAAFNTADRAKIEAFGRDHMPPDFMRAAIIDQTLQMSENSGGLDLLDATESSPHAIKGHVRERKTNDVVEITVEVDAASPERITTILLKDPDELVKAPAK